MNVLESVSTIKHRAMRRFERFRGVFPVHFLHIGKTGGTAVKTTLMHNLRSARYRIHLHEHSVRLQDIPHNDLVFFFLRDPIHRFISGFYSRQRQGQPRYHSPWTLDEQEAFRRFGTPNELANALSSIHKKDQGEATRAMRAIQHVRNSYWQWFGNLEYFLARRAYIFFIGYQESLNTDFERLRLKLGLSESVTLPSDDVRSHRNPKDLDKSLSREAIHNLREWYKEDYRCLQICKSMSELVCRAS